MTPIAGFLILSLVCSLVVHFVAEGLARLRHGVWPSDALRVHRRWRLTFEAIAGARLTADPNTAMLTEAQWMQGLARRALSAPLTEPRDPRKEIDELVGAAMSVHNLRQGNVAPAPREERPPT